MYFLSDRIFLQQIIKNLSFEYILTECSSYSLQNQEDNEEFKIQNWKAYIQQLFVRLSQIMDITADHQALLQKHQKKKGLLVIRIYMNDLEDAHPLRKFVLKEKSNRQSKQKQKSCSKRRTSSMKLFANAHVASQNETFLNLHHHSKNSNDLKNQNENRNTKTKLQKNNTKRTLNVDLSNRKIKCIGDGNSQSEIQLKGIKKEVNNSEKLKEGINNYLIGELTKIIWEETGGELDNRYFEFADESSIYGEEDAYTFQIGRNERQEAEQSKQMN